MLLGLKCPYVQGAETPIVIRLDSTGLLEYKDLRSEVKIVKKFPPLPAYDKMENVMKFKCLCLTVF